MRKIGGCSDNPISYLLKILEEGHGEFTVLTKKTLIPLELARLIAMRKGYRVDVISDVGDELKLRFYREK